MIGLTFNSATAHFTALPAPLCSERRYTNKKGGSKAAFF
jgi:hypothetical protein